LKNNNAQIETIRMQLDRVKALIDLSRKEMFKERPRASYVLIRIEKALKIAEAVK